MLNIDSDFKQMHVVEQGTTTIKFHLLSVSYKVKKPALHADHTHL
jgi:hypothetical protein